MHDRSTCFTLFNLLIMKNSKEFREWEIDLAYLSQAYDINPALTMERTDDVFAQISRATVLLSEDIENLLGHHSGKSLITFLKTSAGSLYELYNLLRISLHQNLISIDEYHDLMTNINEIGEIINIII